MIKTRMLTVTVTGLMASISCSALASEAYGNPFEAEGFVKDDWQLVCDNTLTCRAAGYNADGHSPASMLLEVAPLQREVRAKLNYQTDNDEQLKPGNKPFLWLNDKNYGEIKDSQFSKKQTEQILKQAKKNTRIEIRSGKEIWQISDKGLSAILLKLDAVQGRAGTPLALISKQHPHPQEPLPPQPKPVIYQGFAYGEDEYIALPAATIANFKSNIEQWINIDDEKLIGSRDEFGACELVNPKTEAYKQFAEYNSKGLGWKFIGVDARHTLASHLCWGGAYNMGYGYWLINNSQPNTPKLITTSGTDYIKGEIWAVHKSRGIGDCWGKQQWVWNGQSFILSEELTTGLCRGFAGGAWQLPTYVSQVIEYE